MSHKQPKDAKMSESGAKDVRKTPGKGSKMPPMPAARKMAKAKKGY